MPEPTAAPTTVLLAAAVLYYAALTLFAAVCLTQSARDRRRAADAARDARWWQAWGTGPLWDGWCRGDGEGV